MHLVLHFLKFNIINMLLVLEDCAFWVCALGFRGGLILMLFKIIFSCSFEWVVMVFSLNYVILHLRYCKGVCDTSIYLILIKFYAAFKFKWVLKSFFLSAFKLVAALEEGAPTNKGWDTPTSGSTICLSLCVPFILHSICKLDNKLY